MAPAPDSPFQIEGLGQGPGRVPPARSAAERLPPPPPGGAAALHPESPAWSVVPWLLLIFGAAAVFFTQRGMGYSWDEAYYYEPARDAADWTAQAFAGEPVLNQEKIDLYWGERSEHPSFQKLISGFSLLVFEEQLGPLAAMRLPMALLFGATLALIFALGRRAWNAPAGLVAALSYAFMPRLFGHAHFASMETPLLFSTVLAVYCFVRGLDSRAWAVMAGASLGLLLATKINGFFLIPPLILWAHLFAYPRYVNNLFAMLTVGPVVFVLLWPWLWPDPVFRFLQYLAFHATHQQTAVWFLGRKFGYGDELAPWFYPSLITAVVTPAVALALAAAGIFVSAAGALRRPLPALYLMVGLVTWAVASAPGTPKYDGERLFLPLFPFLALMAGGGAWAALAAAGRFSHDPAASPRLARLALAGLVLAVVTEGGLAIARYQPHLLSYFNVLVGGIAGAERRGFEVAYWGDSVNEDVIETLNATIPDGENLAVLALHAKCFEHLQQWGKLSPRIRIGGDPPYYAHLLQMRKGFFGRPERALAESSLFRPIKEWRAGDVKLLGLYRTGIPFEQYWPMHEAGGGPPAARLPAAEDGATTDTKTAPTP